MAEPTSLKQPVEPGLERCAANPLIRPRNVKPSNPAFRVRGAFNPGATVLPHADGSDEIVLLLRVAEDVPTDDGRIAVPTVRMDGDRGVPDVIEVGVNDAGVELRDTRGVVIDGVEYLSTMSHLRLARSTDGENFIVDDEPFIFPSHTSERYGVEDARITAFDDGHYVINYTAVSPDGWATALASTRDFESVERHWLIFHPQNKDVAIFPSRLAGKFAALHRPNNALGKASIWYAESPDLVHWGNHTCVMRPRENDWEAVKIGGGAPPILTDDGWLHIYHAKGVNDVYSLWAVLLDAERPWIVRAQGTQPLMIPDATYETDGFFGGVVFTNGMVQQGDDLLVYYGAADESTALARTSLQSVMANLVG